MLTVVPLHRLVLPDVGAGQLQRLLLRRAPDGHRHLLQNAGHDPAVGDAQRQAADADGAADEHPILARFLHNSSTTI